MPLATGATTYASAGAVAAGLAISLLNPAQPPVQAPLGPVWWCMEAVPMKPECNEPRQVPKDRPGPMNHNHPEAKPPADRITRREPCLHNLLPRPTAVACPRAGWL